MTRSQIVRNVLAIAIPLLVLGVVLVQSARDLSVDWVMRSLALIVPVVLAYVFLRTRFKAQLSRNRSLDVGLAALFWIVMFVICFVVP